MFICAAIPGVDLSCAVDLLIFPVLCCFSNFSYFLYICIVLNQVFVFSRFFILIFCNRYVFFLLSEQKTLDGMLSALLNAFTGGSGSEGPHPGGLRQEEQR